MKKLKKLTVIGIAAALMVISCAAAVVTGLDQRLIEYFGAKPEDIELISPAAVAVNETHTYENGWTVKFEQVLADRWSIAALVEVTAPEGTVLTEDDYFWLACDQLDANGEHVRGGWTGNCDVIQDDGPAENCMTMLWRFSTQSIESMKPYTGGYVGFMVRRLYRSDGSEVQFENWKCIVKLPDTDSGLAYMVDQSISIAGKSLKLSSVYLSPLYFTFHLNEGADPLFTYPDDTGSSLQARIGSDVGHDIVLTLQNGTEVPAASVNGLYTGQTGDASPEGNYSFLLPQVTDPAQVISVTLFGQTYELK